MKEIILNHPLVEHKISILRDKNTGTKEFRELISEITIFLCYEAMKDAKLKKTKTTTPITTCNTNKLDENNYVFVPILRAGLGMVDGILKLIPNAKVGHIGLYRNEETLEPVKYLFKVPKNIQNKEVILLDPMLATGGSAIDAINKLNKDGFSNIKMVSIVGAPEGINNLKQKVKNVDLFIAAIDEKLNKDGYIIPGLGDAGDRIFGTK